MSLIEQIQTRATTPEIQAILQGYLKAKNMPPVFNFTCSPDDVAIVTNKNGLKRTIGVLQGRDFIREFPFSNQIKVKEMMIGFNWKVFEFIENLYERIIFIDHDAKQIGYITKQDIDILNLKDKRISEDGDEQWCMDVNLLSPLTYQKVKMHYVTKEIQV